MKFTRNQSCWIRQKMKKTEFDTDLCLGPRKRDYMNYFWKNGLREIEWSHGVTGVWSWIPKQNTIFLIGREDGKNTRWPQGNEVITTYREENLSSLSVQCKASCYSHPVINQCHHVSLIWLNLYLAKGTMLSSEGKEFPKLPSIHCLRQVALAHSGLSTGCYFWKAKQVVSHVMIWV